MVRPRTRSQPRPEPTSLRDPARLAAVRATGLLDSPPDAAFDQIGEITRRLLRTPMAQLSLVTDDRQFFKCALGLPDPWQKRRETPISHSYCQNVVLSAKPLAITDARRSPRFRKHPALLELGIVAYLGMPVRASTGEVLGALCAMDRKPRRWTAAERKTLAQLAAHTEALIRAASGDPGMSDGAEWRRAERIQRATFRIAQTAATAPGLAELLAEIHAVVAELMPARNLYVALVDEEQDRLTFPYYVDEKVPPTTSRPLRRGLTEYVLRTGRPQLVTPEVHRQLQAAGEVQAIGVPAIDWIGVPLRPRDKAIGVLVVQSYTEGVRYGEAEKEILEFVSTQVALAIERRRTEEQLRASEVKYRLLFEDNPEPMWVFDTATLRFLAVNDAAIQRYGWSREEFLAMTILDIRPPGERQAIAGRVRQPLDGPELRTGHHHCRKDGTVFDVEVLVDSTEFGGRPARLAMVRDISERKRLEGQLQQAQRLEAVGRLAGGVAHDFNNLLTAVMGYSDLLLETFAPTDERRDDLEEIRKATRRAASLTQQLLAYSRQQVLQPKVIDLNTVVTGTTRLLHRLIGENIILEPELERGLGAIRADPAQLEQVIVNLAVNARDAMPGGGRLRLATRSVTLSAEDAVEHPLTSAGRYVELTVSDTGNGMDEETAARLFEPFFTTKGPGKGTGLGLSTVYGIVQQSGGTIEVESAPGRGTAFTILLPQVDARPETAHATLPPVSPPTGSETVLLVEDEPALRAVARRALERRGYRILEASDGEIALALAAAHTDRIDLLVTDVVMPGVSGREVATTLTAVRPGLRVLYMSGYTDDAIVHHGVLDPSLAFLQKPFTPDQLTLKVREVLDAS